MTACDPASDPSEQIISKLLEERGPGKSICPSEAARVCAELAGRSGEWRQWLSSVRAAGIRMAQEGSIVIVQKGERVRPECVRGAIRFRLP